MLCVPSIDIGLTARNFLQDHRRRAYLQPVNWSSIGPAGDLGDDDPATNMHVDDGGGGGSSGIYGTTSTHTIGGSLSRAELESLHLHLSESELLENIAEENEEEEEEGASFTLPETNVPPAAQSKALHSTMKKSLTAKSYI